MCELTRCWTIHQSTYEGANVVKQKRFNLWLLPLADFGIRIGQNWDNVNSRYATRHRLVNDATNFYLLVSRHE